MPTKLQPLWSAALFALLCLAWGSSWLALKSGATALPPLLFAAGRFLGAAGVMLALLAALGRLPRLRSVSWRAALPGALLMLAVNYGLMAWGIARAGSGIAAVVNLATVPLAMAAFGAAYRVAPLTWRTGAGLAMGSMGLALLLAQPGAGAGDALSAATGLGAVATGAACYAWGSLVTRRRMGDAPALELGTVQTLQGGGALLLASALAEPWVGASVALTPALLAGWGFLVTVTVASTPAYLALLKRWPPARMAAYAYVCPVIALAQGWLVAGETISAHQAIGCATLAASAWLVLGARAGPPSATPNPIVPEPITPTPAAGASP